MLTPFSTSAALKNMTPEERKEEMLKRDGYNFYQSSLRICIECAFGMLIRRFGIFWRAMTGTLEHTQLIILTAMCLQLHNVCIDERGSDDAEKAMPIPHKHQDGFRDAPRTHRDNQNRVQVEGRPVLHDQSDCTTQSNQGRRSDLHAGKLRDELKERMHLAGMKRPPHSRWGLASAKKRKKRRDQIEQRQPLE